MKLKVNQGIILIFLCESFKKKRRKPQEKQRNKKQFIVYVFFAPEKRKISKNYSLFNFSSTLVFFAWIFFKPFFYKMDFHP